MWLILHVNPPVKHVRLHYCKQSDNPITLSRHYRRKFSTKNEGAA